MEYSSKMASALAIAVTVLAVAMCQISPPLVAQVCLAADGEDEELKDTTITDAREVEVCDTITIGPNLGVTGPNGSLTLWAGGMVVFVPNVSFGFDSTMIAAAAVSGSAYVEKSGQQLCFDASGLSANTVTCAGTGQDGELQKGVGSPDPRFTDNLDGTVRDNLTGLIWLKEANCFGAVNTFWGAPGDAWALQSGSCGLTDGSQRGDWRVPNVKELQSLVDFGHESPALPPDGIVFSNVQSGVNTGYWSSTTKAFGPTVPDNGWFVEMEGGSSQFRGKAFGYSVWPVRGISGGPAPVEATGQQLCYDNVGSTTSTTPCSGTFQDGETQAGVVWPSPRFTDNLDGTVTDRLTDLIWLKNANCWPGGGLNRTWAEALTDANSLQSGSCGLADGSAVGEWRLPNQKELQSLLDFSQADWALPLGHLFANVQSDWFYWSSTSVIQSPSDAWAVSMGVDFGAGTSTWSYKGNRNHVWAVRGGQ